MNEIFLCAQCATHVIWPKTMKPSEKQPYVKMPCKLCGRTCYGTMYTIEKGEKRCQTTTDTDSKKN